MRNQCPISLDPGASVLHVFYMHRSPPVAVHWHRVAYVKGAAHTRAFSVSRCLFEPAFAKPTSPSVQSICVLGHIRLTVNLRQESAMHYA